MNMLLRLLAERDRKELTQRDVDDYITDGGCLCPFCKGNLISDDGPFEVGPGFARHSVRCLDCGASWQDRYAHIGVSVPREKGEDYFYAETDADRAVTALIDEIEGLLDQDGDTARQAALHLLAVLDRIAPEVVEQRYKDFPGNR